MESFNQKKFCRFCLTDRQNIQNVFSEDQCELRTKANYDINLLNIDPKETGIVGKCPFEGIGNFHPMKNITVDVAHDLLEGGCRYDLGCILNYFLKGKFFTLLQLNNYIKGFNYGPIKNKPTEVLQSHMKEKKIIMSASEMFTLVINLPIIIGHLIPHENTVWQLLLSMQKMIIIAMSSCIEKHTHLVLNIKITEYLESLSEVFPGSLRPKHHFLIHHARVMRYCGPLSKISR